MWKNKCPECGLETEYDWINPDTPEGKAMCHKCSSKLGITGRCPVCKASTWEGMRVHTEDCSEMKKPKDA